MQVLSELLWQIAQGAAALVYCYPGSKTPRPRPLASNVEFSPKLNY